MWNYLYSFSWSLYNWTNSCLPNLDLRFSSYLLYYLINITGSDNKVLQELADCRQYCAEGLGEAEACGDIEKQAEFLIQGATLNIVEGKSLEHTISLLQVRIFLTKYNVALQIEDLLPMHNNTQHLPRQAVCKRHMCICFQKFVQIFSVYLHTIALVFSSFHWIIVEILMNFRTLSTYWQGYPVPLYLVHKWRLLL